MPADVQIQTEIQFVTDMAAGLTGDIPERCQTGCVIEKIPVVRQIEAVVLRDECDPRHRVHGELRVEVMNILTSDTIQETHIVVTEWKQLVERIAAAIGMAAVAGCEVVADPTLRIHRQWEAITDTGSCGKRGYVQS